MSRRDRARRSLRRRRPDGPSRPPTEALRGITVGDLGGPTAVVDPKGSISALDGSWRIEFGAGADDRWHLAHDEVAVRQHRVDDAPVVATSMRVPGGDLVQRVASVSDGRGRALVVELENDSPAALAAAFVVRASGVVDAATDRLEIGGIVVRPDRRAGGVVGSDTDPWPEVVAGPGAEPVSGDAGVDGGGALVVAVPHRQTVTFTVSLGGEPPERVPTAAQVASGWRTVTAGAATIAMPDHDLTEAWRRIVPDLVIAAGSDRAELAAQAAWFLDVVGLSDEADRARVSLIAAAEHGELRGDEAVAALLALASRDLRTDEPSGLDALAGPLAAMAGDAATSSVLSVVAAALALRSSDAAADARRLAESSPRRGWWAPVAPVIEGASSVIGAVIDEDPPSRISLLPSVPAGWRGGEIDARGLRTLMGAISFSVRWHGARPALLWEREGGPETVGIVVPGLDRDWESSERSGEALLTEPQEPPRR